MLTGTPKLWPAAVAVLPEEFVHAWPERMGRELPADLAGLSEARLGEWPALWKEMTEVRRSVPRAEW